MWNIFWVQVVFFAKKVTFLLENLKIFLFFMIFPPKKVCELFVELRTSSSSNFLITVQKVELSNSS